MNIRLKIHRDISIESIDCLNKDMLKKVKNNTFCTSALAIPIATGANLLHTKYHFYEFNGDLRDTIN